MYSQPTSTPEKDALRWEIHGNTIARLLYHERDIINPWGVETADASSFFSLENGVGWRYSIEDAEHTHDRKESRVTLVVQMREGRFRLNVHDRIMDRCVISRTVQAEILEDSWFMDFVMRFRFKKDLFPFARIDGMEYRHENSAIYHQFPVSGALLRGPGLSVTVQVRKALMPDNLTPVFYVCDVPGEWTVHARMIPRVWEREVIKLCTPWFRTSPLPDPLSRLLLRVPRLREWLWYRTERRADTPLLWKPFNPNAYPLVLVPRGEILRWEADMVIA